MERKNISVLGAGLSCIDIIKADTNEKNMLGGTAANIASILAALGAKVDFLAAHYSGGSGKWLEDAFHRRGIQLSYFAQTSFPAPKIIEILDEYTGKHIFQTKCIDCDKTICRLVLPSGSQINKIPDITEKPYNLFVYDRISEGIRLIAQKNERGWNLYEPNSIRMYSNFLMCAKTADILKISKERISSAYQSRLLHDMRDTRVQLIIVSLGEAGLKFSLRNRSGEFSDWVYMKGVPSKRVVDSSGAGDWMTAIFLLFFLQQYPWRYTNIAGKIIYECLAQAQTVAKISCEYTGAQGMLCDMQGVNYLSARFGIPIEMISDEVYEGETCETCRI